MEDCAHLRADDRIRLGRIRTPQGPGTVLLLPFIDPVQRVHPRTRAFGVPPCKLAAKDGAVLSVGADVQFRIWDPILSVMTVKDLNTATRMTAQNAMTKALLKRPLREIQMEKLKISDQLSLEISDVTRAWGLEVDHVELAVEAMLQPPQDSPLQQLAPHLLGVGMSSVAGSALLLGRDTLEIVSEVELPAPHIGAGRSSKQPVAERLLTTLQPYLSETLVSRVGACYQFNVILPSGTQSVYFLNLTAGRGRVGRGEPDSIPDAEVEVAVAPGGLREWVAKGEGRPCSGHEAGGCPQNPEVAALADCPQPSPSLAPSRGILDEEAWALPLRLLSL